MHQAEERTGLVYGGAAKLKVYATVAAFRDATGEPGWVAASTRGRTIRLQPTDVLRNSGTLEATLRHELLHMLLEAYAKPGTPLWYREGLVLYLAQPNAGARASATFDNTATLEKTLRAPAGEQELRQAYADAQSRVARLAREQSLETLLVWLHNGLPSEVAGKP